MHIKSKIWDISFEQIDISLYPVIAVKTNNAFFGKIIKEMLSPSLPELETFLGNEVTEDWVQRELKTLDLFGGTSSYFIHFADSILKQNAEELKNLDELILENRKLYLNFEGDHLLFRAWSKVDNCLTIQIDSVNFWEFDKLTSFLIKHFSLRLTPMQLNKVKTELPEEVDTFFNFFNQLNVLSQNGEVSDRDIDSILTNQKETNQAF